ncbi:MAG: DUF3105 domain-containing protein [Chloroflexota bacterium]
MSGNSKNQSRREQIRQRQRKQQSSSKLIFSIAGAGVVVVLGYLLFSFDRPDAPEGDVGILVDLMEPSDHVADGTNVEYSTNPPTSGPHYGQPMPAGVYNASQNTVIFPESHIVHSLEHGYVVFWYNCSNLPVSECDELLGQIRAVLDDVGEAKVIVYPWSTIDEPLVMTSWGAIQPFPVFDAQLAADFVLANRSNPRAPEPNVQ